MKKLGLITIGQSPRTDVTPDLAPIFGPDIQLCQAGALDGMTAQEIAAFAPEEGDYVLISRLRDGSSAVFAEKHILPRLPPKRSSGSSVWRSGAAMSSLLK